MSFFPSKISRAEIRKAPRRRLHHPALIDRTDGTSPVSCMIWDISAIGAKLTVMRQDQIPDQFELLLSATGGGGRRRCQVIWRSQLEVGVRFVTGQQAAPASIPTQLDC